MTRPTQPLVSIVMPAYNYAHTLGAAIDSVLSQGLQEIEILILDDASTDSTPAVAAAYADDPRVRYFRHAENLGSVRNSNFGLRQARGRYITILAADDLLMRGYFEQVFRFKQVHPQAQAVYTAINVFEDEKLGFESRVGLISVSYCGGRDEFSGFLAHGCYAFFGSILADRALYEKYGLLDESMGAGTDLELLIRWAKNDVIFGYVAQPLVSFRVHPNQLSGPKRYNASGLLATEFLAIAERHIEPATYARLHGYEHAIMRHLSYKYSTVSDAGYVDDGSLHDRIVTHRATLKAIRAECMTRTMPVSVALIVLDVSDLEDLQLTITSVLAQTDAQFEILVVTSRTDISDRQMTAWDQLGRLRVVRVPHEMPEGRRLNTSIRVSGADAFCFLQSGSRIEADHMGTIRQVFSTQACEGIIVQPRLEVLAAGSTSLHEDAFLSIAELDFSLVANVIPIDAMAVRRRLIDKYFLFTEEINAWSAWEFFLRVRAREVFALAQDLSVIIRSRPESLRRFTQRKDLLPLLDILYANYQFSCDDPRCEDRSIYRRELEATLENWDRLSVSAAGIVTLTQALYGASTRTAPALARA